MSVLAASPEFVANNPGTVMLILQALVKAENFLTKHNETSLGIVKAHLKNQSQESIEGTWKLAEKKLGLSNLLLTLLQDEALWMKQQNVYEGDVPNFSEVLETSHLNSVKPELVTVVQ